MLYRAENCRPSMDAAVAASIFSSPEKAFNPLAQQVKSHSMTRSDLIASLASRFPHLVAKDAEISVKEILDAISLSLTKGDRVEIRGFGSFDLNYRPPRTGRNPKTGEKVQVAAKRVPHFKAGKEMRERIDDSVKSVDLHLNLTRELH